MSRVHALKFLILQTLNKNKSKISESLHIEIAKSLNINQKNESLILSWRANSVEKNIIADEKKFNFYIRSEFDQKSNTKQIDDNEINAQDLILKIIKLSLN